MRKIDLHNKFHIINTVCTRCKTCYYIGKMTLPGDHLNDDNCGLSWLEVEIQQNYAAEETNPRYFLIESYQKLNPGV